VGLKAETFLRKTVGHLTKQQLLYMLHLVEQLETEVRNLGPELRIVRAELAKRRQQKDQ